MTPQTLFGWTAPTPDVPTGIPASAVSSGSLSLTFSDDVDDGHIIIAQPVVLGNIVEIGEVGHPFTQIAQFALGEETFVMGRTPFRYWYSVFPQTGTSLMGETITVER